MDTNSINANAQAEFFKSSVLPSVSQVGGGGVKEATESFEAIFIKDLLTVMRKATSEGGLFNSGNSGKIYSSMIDTELSKSLAKGRGLGLGQMLLRQLEKDGVVDAAKGMKPLKAEQAPEPKGSAGLSVLKGAEGISGEAGGEAGKVLKYEMPVEGTISSNYGMRTHPIRQSKEFHNGVDISTYEGAPVYPAADGEVSYVGKSDSYGNFVEVKHDDGIVSRYAHLHSHLVKEGDTVKASRPFAFVGNTGRSTAAHLHFELLRDGKALDPDQLLDGD